MHKQQAVTVQQWQVYGLMGQAYACTTAMVSLLGNLCHLKDMPDGQDMSEDASLDQLAEKECHELLNSVGSFACEA